MAATTAPGRVPTPLRSGLMTGTHAGLAEAMRRMIEANGAHRAALAANAELMGECLTRLESGESPVSVLRDTPVAAGRSAVKVTEDALTEARLSFRIELISSCMVEGMSRKEVATSMGFSPQLVSRYLRAAEEQG